MGAVKRQGWIVLLLPMCLAMLLMACTRTPIVPIPMLEYPAPAVAPDEPKRLLILLHGLGSTMEDFADYGFVSAAQERYPGLTIWVPDAHLGYYRQRSLMTRLQVDLIARARAQGYQRIDLAGVSLGGLGGLLYLQCCEADIHKVLLISPFTGTPRLHASLAKAPSLTAWQPEERLADFQVDLWQWLGAHPEVLQSDRIWLAYGDNDRLRGHDFLAKELPPAQTVILPGEHKNPVFARLWQKLLSAGALE